VVIVSTDLGNPFPGLTHRVPSLSVPIVPSVVLVSPVIVIVLRVVIVVLIIVILLLLRIPVVILIEGLASLASMSLKVDFLDSADLLEHELLFLTLPMVFLLML
jgi:hypothetical protein